MQARKPASPHRPSALWILLLALMTFGCAPNRPSPGVDPDHDFNQNFENLLDCLSEDADRAIARNPNNSPQYLECLACLNLWCAGGTNFSDAGCACNPAALMAVLCCQSIYFITCYEEENGTLHTLENVETYGARFGDESHEGKAGITFCQSIGQGIPGTKKDGLTKRLQSSGITLPDCDCFP